jgi:hypothetical protein
VFKGKGECLGQLNASTKAYGSAFGPMERYKVGAHLLAQRPLPCEGRAL